MEATLETMLGDFTDPEALMQFAVNWDIQESSSVRFRLYQLRNRDYDNDCVNTRLMEPYHEDTHIQEEIERAVKALLFDEEMESLAEACEQDGEWHPTIIQMGCGEEPQAGPSTEPDHPKLTYTMRKIYERTYAKNAAVDRTYQVKIDEQYNGQQLREVSEGIHDMFQDVMNKARGDLAGNDLGRVVIHHDSLHDPIVVPWQTWDQLDANKVMETLQKVLNSNQTLAINESFYVTIGAIDLPKGGTRRRITRIRGDKNSLDLKKSSVTIENTDQLCMARAIGVSWAKLKRCTPDEWKEVTKNRQGKSNMQLVLEHEKVPLTYYQDLCNKNLKQQGQLAATLCQMSGVPMDRPASLNDVEAFEELLGVRVMVISARLGNKFITSPSTDQRPCIYLYLVDDDHYHAVTSVTGFFSAIYFCDKCLVHYDHREKHQCDTSCIVCKRGNCPKMDLTLKCKGCNIDCRSDECYTKHKEIPLHKKGKKKGKPRGPSECDKWWKCPTCYKVVRTDKRNNDDHECGEYLCKTCRTYVMDDHKCYL